MTLFKISDHLTAAKNNFRQATNYGCQVMRNIKESTKYENRRETISIIVQRPFYF